MRYENFAFGARATVALAPKIEPMPLPAVDPALRLKPPALNETVVPGASRGVFVITDRKSTRLNSSHLVISYAVFCLKKKRTRTPTRTASARLTSHNQVNDMS